MLLGLLSPAHACDVGAGVVTLHPTSTSLQRHTEDCGRVCRGVPIQCEGAGVATTLIDFTLSRLATADGAGAYCDLSADPELFQGPKGDFQVLCKCLLCALCLPQGPSCHLLGHLRLTGIPLASGCDTSVNIEPLQESTCQVPQHA